MTIRERATQIIRLRDNRSRLLAGAVALALLAAVGGVLIGRSTVPDPAPTQTEKTDKANERRAPEGFVPMSAAQIAASGIAVERIEPGSLVQEVIAPATVTAPPQGQALVTARADGAVVRIDKRLGDPVRAGETLALLESRDAATLVAERNAALARERAAHAAAARELRLFNARITARQDLEAANSAHEIAESELRRTQTALQAAGVTGERYLAVRSPITGRITELDTQLGAYVTAGAELFNVADPNRIQINAAVLAPQAQNLQPGDPARIELPLGGVADAVVRSISPSADPQTRAVAVVLQVTGTPGGLRQGQAVRARITPRTSKMTGIVLPEEAVQQVEGRDVVFVRTRNGLRAQPVSVGERSGGRVEILSGIQTGQQVATTNVFQLKAELAKGAGEEE